MKVWIWTLEEVNFEEKIAPCSLGFVYLVTDPVCSISQWGVVVEIAEQKQFMSIKANYLSMISVDNVIERKLAQPPNS